VLDDVTSRYAKASGALNTCNASLDAALQFLLDAKFFSTPKRQHC
jgi:hypothetical protein